MTIEELHGDSPFSKPEWQQFLEDCASHKGVTFTEMMAHMSSEEFEILANTYLNHIYKEKDV